MKHFGITDYVVFVGMLVLSAVIGIYYGCVGGRQRTSGEFLMANRQMGIVPVSLSMLASFLSGISLIGAPTEVYLFGYMVYLMMIGFMFAIIVAAALFLPVFYNLQVISAFEYLERRFNRVIRVAACILYILQMLMYMAIVTYAPALALSQVTGLHPWGCVGAIGGVCIFYTTIGGMKAVMWTDAVQIIIMFASMICVVVKGTIDVGGLNVIINKSIEGKRLHPIETSLDPTVRHSVWGLAIGGFFTYVAMYGTNQVQVQRFLTSPSRRSATIAVLLNMPGFILMKTICCFAGLIIYTKYWDCDPKSSGKIHASDQMIPIFVMDLLSHIPGIAGLFVAGVFSGSLSTLSSGLNSLAAITLEDLIKTAYKKSISDEAAATISKFLAILYGGLCIGMVAAAERLGNIAQATISVAGITNGPVLGLFTLGMFFPWTNTWGASIGFLTSICFVGWIGIGAQLSHVPKPFLPVSIDGCNMTISNITFQRLNPSSSSEGIFYLYRISYLWYSVLAFSTFLIVGLLISLITGCNNTQNLDVNLLNCIGKKFLIKSSSDQFKEMNSFKINTNKKQDTQVPSEKACENVAYENTENAITRI